MSEAEHLFGTQGAEVLYLDVGTLYESEVEPNYKPDPNLRIEVEEHTTHPPTYHLPTADSVLEWMVEWAGENGELDEYGYDAFANATKAPDVLAAAEALREAIGSHVAYFMADKVIATHWLSWDEKGEPTYDGDPLYVHAPSAEESPRG